MPTAGVGTPDLRAGVIIEGRHFDCSRIELSQRPVLDAWGMTNSDHRVSGIGGQNYLSLDLTCGPDDQDAFRVVLDAFESARAISCQVPDGQMEFRGHITRIQHDRQMITNVLILTLEIRVNGTAPYDPDDALVATIKRIRRVAARGNDPATGTT